MGAAKRFTKAGNRLTISRGGNVSRLEIRKPRETPEWSEATEAAFHALACDEQDLIQASGLDEFPHYAGFRVVLVSVLTSRIDDVLERLYALERKD